MKECHINRPGAIGDIIMTLQVIHKYKQLHPEDRIIYYCDSTWLDLPKICRDIDEVRPSSEFNINTPGAQNLYGYSETPLKHHLMYYFGKELGLNDKFDTYGFNTNLKINPDNHSITIHPFAQWSSYKNWDINKWQEIIDKLQDYQIIQLGLANEPALKNVIDMRGKLSLIESITTIKNARLHLGVDSFSNHVTALLPLTPSVILWGSTHPMIFGYGHNINIWKPLKCSPCNKNNDGLLGKCQLDNQQCIDSITVEEVMTSVIKLLDITKGEDNVK
jgi:ADP-heptose:LPS heptosyltransferase